MSLEDSRSLLRRLSPDQPLFDVVQTGHQITHTLDHVMRTRLGQTPFRMGSDRNDLLHGETLMFRKPGYKDGQIRYATGEYQYHVVLEPINVGER